VNNYALISGTYNRKC